MANYFFFNTDAASKRAANGYRIFEWAALDATLADADTHAKEHVRRQMGLP